jgi:hypothetical protein
MRTVGLREVASIRRRELGDGAFRYDVTYRDPDGKQRMKTFRLKRSAVAFGNKMETDCGSTPTLMPSSAERSRKAIDAMFAPDKAAADLTQIQQVGD